MNGEPDRKTFIERARRGNLIPVWRELLADMDTPLSALYRLNATLKDGEGLSGSFLLESVEGGERLGRYSFLGARPRALFRAFGSQAEIEHADGRRETVEGRDPLDALKNYMARFTAVMDPALPRFFGGAVGYLSYDTVAQFERLPLAPEKDTAWPDMAFAVTDTLLVFDHVRHTLKVVANAFIEGDPGRAYDEAVERIDRLCEGLAQPATHHLIDAHALGEPAPARSNLAPGQFQEAVLRAKDYIRAGDIIQVVLSQRFEVEDPGRPLDVYRALRSINPSPYMFALQFGERQLIGSSPEIHLRCLDGHAEVRPIAGTRPRSIDPEEDARLAAELLADPKERAEHIMLVDLGRNDLGRVCRFGSVRVPDLMVIERYSHVMHIVSDVVGELDDRNDAYDALRATFPAGTVSGAPKIRAMEIIAELEPLRRGPYAGAVGYFGYDGHLDSCITIRTALFDGRRAHVQAGAGIVADSDPDRECEETRNKARGLLTAIGAARRSAAARGVSV